MAKPGRPPVLDAMKQRDIITILSVGCSRRTAARYVGCVPSTIQNTADRDSKFSNKLHHAESQAVVTHMTNINKAAKKEQYWRAAAWVLERLSPEEYAAPHPNVITAEQISQFMADLVQIIIEEVPVGAYRKKIIKRLNKLTKLTSTLTSNNHATKSDDAGNNTGH